MKIITQMRNDHKLSLITSTGFHDIRLEYHLPDTGYRKVLCTILRKILSVTTLN